MLIDNKTIGFGSEFGRSSYGSGIKGLSYESYSGFYIAPFAAYKNYKLGC